MEIHFVGKLSQIRICVSIITLPTATLNSVYIAASNFKLRLSKNVVNNSLNWRGI